MIRKIVNILRYVFVRHRKYQFARQGKKVIIGNGCIINSASMIEFGDNVSIGPNAVLYAIYKKIIFGNNVMLGPHVTIVNGDHNIRKIGVALGVIEDDEDIDELGAKAMEADKKPEDFEYVSDYIQYLKDEVQLDREKSEKADDKTKAARKAVGATIVAKGIEEKKDTNIQIGRASCRERVSSPV